MLIPDARPTPQESGIRSLEPKPVERSNGAAPTLLPDAWKRWVTGCDAA